jgi:hypothetical protein
MGYKLNVCAHASMLGLPSSRCSFHLGDGPLKGNRNLKCTYCTTHDLTCRYQESSQVRLNSLSVPDAEDQQAKTGSVQEVRLA